MTQEEIEKEAKITIKKTIKILDYFYENGMATPIDMVYIYAGNLLAEAIKTQQTQAKDVPQREIDDCEN
jgi:hypothetical protein